MKSSQAAVQIKNSLNKLDSSKYQNLDLTHIQEAVNSAALRWQRVGLASKELNNIAVDDLQVLLKGPTRLSGSMKDVFFLTHKLPDDYIGYSTLYAIATKGTCEPVKIKSDLREDANAPTLLSTWTTQPSYEFEQCFHTIAGNKIKLYHNNDFKVSDVEITYYRKPAYIEFPGAYLSSGGIGRDSTWEFNDAISDVIIEWAVEILAGRIENINAFQIAGRNKQELKQ